MDVILRRSNRYG